MAPSVLSASELMSVAKMRSSGDWAMKRTRCMPWAATSMSKSAGSERVMVLPLARWRMWGLRAVCALAAKSGEEEQGEHAESQHGLMVADGWFSLALVFWSCNGEIEGVSPLRLDEAHPSSENACRWGPGAFALVEMTVVAARRR